MTAKLTAETVLSLGEIENDLPQVLIDGVEQGNPEFKDRMAAKQEMINRLI